MIGYMTVGTNDLKKAGEFYDKVCGELGMGRFMADERLIAWGGKGQGEVRERGRREMMRNFGIGTLAATCEGPPGSRSQQFYAAYFRAPDGNKLNAFVMRH